MPTTNNLDILSHLVTQLSLIATSAMTASATYASGTLVLPATYSASGSMTASATYTSVTMTASATYYNNTVKSVDREYIERPYDEFPFIFINDISDKYIQRINKDLYRKFLEIQLVGLISDDRSNTHTPQLGTTLQRFKDDVQVCLSLDAYFNASDKELQILTIDTEDNYVPPNASFICSVYVQYYSTK